MERPFCEFHALTVMERTCGLLLAFTTRMMKWVSKTAGIATICVAVLGASSCDDARAEQQSAPAQQVTENDARAYREVASTAWRYLDRYYQPSTGFVNATPDWFNTTLWDIGGQLLAQHGAM